MLAPLTLQDIINVHDLSSLARMFHRLGYQTEDDFDVATHHPDEAGLSESVSKHIHRLGIVWSQDDLHIIHFFLNELKGRVFRGIANDMLARPGNYLLTFSPRNLSRLVIVKPIRAGGKIHLGRLDVSLRPPSSEALKVLRQIAIDPVDSSSEANARQIEVFTALEESFDLEESP